MGNDISLPKQVREAGEQADKDLKALLEKPEGEAQGSQGDPGNTLLGPDGKPIQAAPSGGTPLGKDEGNKGIDWKAEHEALLHKNKVLQGKYDNEVPILHRELKDVKETLAKLQERSNTPAVSTGGGESPETPEAPPEAIVELYGEDLIKFIGDRARLEATNAMKPLSDRVDTVTQENENTRKDAFFTRLLEAHSDWEQINALDAFKSFLSEIVPELGMERQVIINNAVRSNNPEPIILQLTAFKQRIDGKGEQARLVPQETPSGEGTPPVNPDLNTEVSLINESDIAAFYTEVAQGKYKNRDKEFAHQERLIQEATMAGKIVMDVTGGKQPPLY